MIETFAPIDGCVLLISASNEFIFLLMMLVDVRDGFIDLPLAGKGSC